MDFLEKGGGVPQEMVVTCLLDNQQNGHSIFCTDTLGDKDEASLRAQYQRCGEVLAWYKEHDPSNHSLPLRFDTFEEDYERLIHNPSSGPHP